MKPHSYSNLCPASGGPHRWIPVPETWGSERLLHRCTACGEVTE